VNSVYRFVVRAAVLLLSTLVPHVAFAQTAAAGPSASPVVFRPGTAAAPYDSATAVADFDADGAPDVAIADRTSRSGSHYDIEVRLSEGSIQTVSFASTRGALHITALDVDNDHDADLVFTPVLSREVVSIWINDGAGHFNAGDRASFASLADGLAAVLSLSGFGDHLIPVVPGRRIYAFGLTASSHTAYLSEEIMSVRLPSVPVAAVAFPPGISPRAPPLSRS